ncbi:MAG: AMP-binding protein, partial [Bacteroidia bacterium]|nr:AMP-binding protein [Bacteroidia bacterium]
MSLVLYKKLRALKVNVKLVNGALDIKGPKGVITPEILTEIKENKLSLVQLIGEFADQKTMHSSIPLADISENYPLSSAQFRLWMLSQFDEGNIAYNDIDVFVFEGTLDFNVLKRSFAALVERHESLRTVFRNNEQEEIRQFILSPSEIGFEPVSIDLRTHSDREKEVKKLIQADLTRPFNLAAGPLLQTRLYQVADHKWIFTYVIHHIINDSWSMQILMKELFVLYNSYLYNTNNPINPLRIQYKDYAVWQQNQKKETSWAVHKSYWLSQLQGPLPVLALLPDKSRPLIKTYNGGQVSFQVANQTLRSLAAFCQTEGGTLFMGLLATLNALLYRYTNQTDIILGSPIAGREHVDLEDQIGVYSNTLTLRTQFSGNDSFKDLFKKVKSTTVGAYEHQAYQFDELVNDLQPVRDMSRSALFDVMIVLQNAETTTTPGNTTSGLSALSISRYNEGEHTKSKFDLTFSFAEQNGELGMNVEYNSDLFYRSTAERIGAHFISFLNASLAHPDTPVQQLNYLTSDEQNYLLKVFDNTNATYPKEKTITELFEEQVTKTPQQIALVYQDVTLSYFSLNQKVNQFAHYLRKVHQIKANDLVAVKLDRSEWMVIAMLATLKSGGAYVPLDVDYPAERIAYVLDDSKSKLLIDAEELDKFKTTANTYSHLNPEPINKPDDRAYVIYTSGTTGQPKGAIIGHRQVVRLFKTEPCMFDFNQQDVWTMFHSYSFDFSVWEMYGALLYGGKLVIVPGIVARDAQAFLKLLSSEGVTVLNQTPSSFYNIIKEEEGAADFKSKLRYVIFGGEALSPAKLRSWFKKYPSAQLINMYGITETTVHVTYQEIGMRQIE